MLTNSGRDVDFSPMNGEMYVVVGAGVKVEDVVANYRLSFCLKPEK